MILFITIPVIILAIFTLITQIRNSIWDGNERFTLIVNSSPLILFSIEPRSQKAQIFSIPENTILNVPSGFAQYQASSVYPLGQLDNKKNGGKLLARSVENTLGIAVDRYVSGPSNTTNITIKSIENASDFKRKNFGITGIPKSILSYINLKTRGDTDLTFLEAYYLWNSIRKLRTDQINFVDASSRPVLAESKLPDGTLVYKIDDYILDTLAGNKFENQNIRMENVTIRVVNASGIDKLATNMGRIIKYAGGNVLVRSTAIDDRVTGCEILIKDKKFEKSVIVSWLKRKYKCEQIKDIDKQIDLQTDIDVILGTDFLK